MIGKILIMKCIAGVICGYLVDLVLIRDTLQREANHIHDFCEQEHCDCDHENNIIFIGIETYNKHYYFNFCCICCIKYFLLSSTENTACAAVPRKHPVWGHILSGLIGLIPNCSASVLITNLYVQGMMGAGMMMTGLFVNAGVGLLVLYKVNHHVKENIMITGVLYVMGIIAGVVCGMILG